MRKKIGNTLAVIAELIIVLSTAYILWEDVLYSAPFWKAGFSGVSREFFNYYTSDSNILCAAAALLALLCRAFGKGKTPRWVSAFEYISASLVTVTFLTTAGFLAPNEVTKGNSYFSMFGNDLFHLHFFNPLLAILIVTCFDKAHRLTRKDALATLLPTVAYAAVYTYNFLNNVWSDFYGFTQGENLARVPYVFALMLCFAYIVARLLGTLHNIGRKTVS